MTKLSKNLPKLLLRPDWTSSNTNLVWMGIGLALVGLNADVASATSSDHADTVNLDDVEAPLENELTDSQQADTLPILTALQVKSSDEGKPLPPLASQSSVENESVSESIRFSHTGADLPEEHETADLVSQLSDPESALSVVPSTTVQVEFEASSVHRLPQSDSVDIGVDPATEALSSRSQSADAPQPLPPHIAAPVVPGAPVLGGDRPSVQRPPTRAQSVQRITPSVRAFPTLESAESGDGSVAPDSELNATQIVYNSDFAEDSTADDISLDLDNPAALSLDDALDQTENVDDAPELAARRSTGITVSVLPVQEAYQSRDRFAFRPPVAVESPTTEAIAYNPNFTPPHTSMPQVPTLGGSPVGSYAVSAASPSAISTHSVPLSHLHPSLPTASLDAMSLQEVQGVLPILIAVPANPPMGRGRSGSDTLPPPPSLPVAASLNFGAAAEQPQNYTTAIPIPQSYPWGQATPASTESIPLPVAAAPWTSPTPVAATRELPLGAYSSPSPAAFNPSAPFSLVALPNQPSAGHSVIPNRWDSGMNSSFESPFIPSEPFDAPGSHSVPSSWRSGDLIGQADPSLPVLIPVEPVFDSAQTPPFPSSQTPESTFPPPSTPPATIQQNSLTGRTPITPPTLQLQGAGILVDDDFSARARLSGTYYLTPQILVGGALDLTEGTAFSDSETEGFNINELYLAASLRDLPNLRFVVGQLDLTSYFDRNSFAKDSLTHFFNPAFQTNPALAANAIGSRPGALINFSPTDNLDVRAAAFSSDRSIGDFDLDGFAGEVGFRVGNLILRGTYVSARDGGTNDGPPEIFGFDRGDDVFGIEEGDREESFGFNAELFIPEINMGLFGRYGRYENLDAGVSADTFSGGFNFLDVFMRNDRLGLAYGRALSNDDLRQERDDKTPDVVEVFYDFPLLSNPNTRLGVTLQQRDEFSETVAGIRIRTTFDILP
ncbi:MAG: hypothetical protein ACFE0I_08320 [Elainellaceae cyanobacterium]